MREGHCGEFIAGTPLNLLSTFLPYSCRWFTRKSLGQSQATILNRATRQIQSLGRSLEQLSRLFRSKRRFLFSTSSCRYRFPPSPTCATRHRPSWLKSKLIARCSRSASHIFTMRGKPTSELVTRCSMASRPSSSTWARSTRSPSFTRIMPCTCVYSARDFWICFARA